jgi:hypothetical protein
MPPTISLRRSSAFTRARSSRGQHQDRHVRLAPERAADLEAIESGEHHIEHDRIRLLAAR